jgi:DNA (cytosine-5)-methyltransferase 1
MNELSLFTGAGGGVYGSKLLNHRVIGYVEFNEYCQKIIRQRIEDGIFDEAPIFTDVRAFADIAEVYRGVTDVLTAGFPCQPFSVAGQRAAEDDERNMWPYVKKICAEIQSPILFLENVPGLLSVGTGSLGDESEGYVHGYFGEILRDLDEIGYDARWTVLGADDCGHGGKHRRKRLWIKCRRRDASND